MFCAGHSERYLPGTNNWWFNLFPYLTKSLCELHHQKFIFNTISCFQMTQTMATTSSWSEQGAEEKRLLSSLDRMESAPVELRSFLEMPPRNQTKSGGGTWACYSRLLSCYTLLSNVWWTDGDGTVPFAPCRLPYMVTFSSVYNISRERSETARCVSLLSIWCAKAYLSNSNNNFNLNFIFPSALQRDFSSSSIDVILKQFFPFIV